MYSVGMMRKKVLLDKKIGQTPLETLQAWKVAHPKYKNVSASYAGRLDPMASGKLLVLLGEECKRQKEYIGLDKVYKIEVLLGVGSDTGDVLGIVSASDTHSVPMKEAVSAVLSEQMGTHTLPYPIFSSKTVAGKPLFLYALEGTLDAIEIPVHEETIHSIQKRGLKIISHTELKKRIVSLLALAPTSDEPSKALGADFRIADVRTSWEAVFESNRGFCVLSLTVRCGSGTYMRSLAQRIGTSLGTQALALSIHRVRLMKPKRRP